MDSTTHTPISSFMHALSQQAQQKLEHGLADAINTERFFVSAGLLQIDLSRQVLNQELLETCLGFGSTIKLEESIASLFSGKTVNPTEQRPALHWLLRAEKKDITPELHDKYDQIQTTFESMRTFCSSVITGEYTASPNTPITDIVNLGVGGSDLGPRLAYDALKNSHNHLNVHFVANIDGNDLYDILNKLKPESTLFVVTSKTFSTLETLENTKAATEWLKHAGISSPGTHFTAATSRPDKADLFGIDPSRIFPMWDWVGGRYSLLSSVGLALMLGIGPKAFDEIRQGARDIDDHVRTTPLERNAAFLQAIVGLIAVNGLGVLNHGVIAYDSRLNLLPAYLQQLEMESNGKSVNLQGEKIDYATCPVIWGGVGTNTQHSFHQLLHQGTLQANIEFLLPLSQDHELDQHQAYLQANCLAQADALVHGKSLDQIRQELLEQKTAEDDIELLAPHKMIPGNRPCSIIGYDILDPATLGAIIALYEQKVYLQSCFWNINPFDQWGVELGKQLCEPLFQTITTPGSTTKDPRTQRWIKLLQK